MKNKEAKSIFSSLENFSSIPPLDLWDKIEKELEQPKKKKRAVAWWFVAASLAVGLSIPIILNFSSNQNKDLELNINTNNNVVLQNDSAPIVKSSKEEDRNEKDILKAADDKTNSNDSVQNGNGIPLNTTGKAQNNTVVILAEPKNSLVTKKAIQKNNSVIVFNNTEKNSESVSGNKTSNTSSSKAIKKASDFDRNSDLTNNNEAVVVQESNKSKPVNGAVISKSILSENKTSQNNILNDGQTSSSVDWNRDNAIAQNTLPKDSSAIIKKEVQQLENVLTALEKKDKKEKKTDSKVVDKWSLQVFAGVMNSENYNNEKLYGNAVASKQSSGYGVKTNYKLNKKWAVSSGFKINQLGQKMDGVAYYQQQSISGSNFLILSDRKSNEAVSISNNSDYLFVSKTDSNQDLATGNITQNLKYLEMPLEVSYSLFNKKKTSINMNTGGFVGKLISNEVTLNGNAIGENRNVNEYVYGTQLSSTLQYEFYKKTKFFIEPGMNYYINPLENQSFNQFQWMFNFGLNLSF